MKNDGTLLFDRNDGQSSWMLQVFVLTLRVFDYFYIDFERSKMRQQDFRTKIGSTVFECERLL